MEVLYFLLELVLLAQLLNQPVRGLAEVERSGNQNILR